MTTEQDNVMIDPYFERITSSSVFEACIPAIIDILFKMWTVASLNKRGTMRHKYPSMLTYAHSPKWVTRYILSGCNASLISVCPQWKSVIPQNLDKVQETQILFELPFVHSRLMRGLKKYTWIRKKDARGFFNWRCSETCLFLVNTDNSWDKTMAARPKIFVCLCKIFHTWLITGIPIFSPAHKGKYFYKTWPVVNFD